MKAGFAILAVTLSALFSFVILEIAVRLFVDFAVYRAQPVGDVNLETELSFIPGRERIYDPPEYTVKVSINEFGRRDDEWSAETLLDPDNILFVGDSFVFGIGANHEATIPSQLEAIGAEKGRPLQVFNFGMPRTAIAEYKLNLEKALEAGIEAKTVVVGIFVGNDFDPQELRRNDKRKRASDPTSQAMKEAKKPTRPSPRSKLVDYIKMRVSHSTTLTGAILQIGRVIGLRLYSTSNSYIFFRHQTPEQIANFREMLGYIGEIQDLTRAHDRKLRIVIIPNKIQVENVGDLTNASYEADKPNRLIAEYSSEHGISYFDLLPVLTAEYARTGEPLYYAVDRHFTEPGYSFAAKKIAEYLERADLMD
jgi:hypothetical protein